MKKTSSKDQVLIGKVGSPSGLRGEVRITLYQQDSTNLKEGKVLLLKHVGKKQVAGHAAEKQLADHAAEKNPASRSGRSKHFAPSGQSKQVAPGGHSESRDLKTKVERVRYQKDRPVVKLEGIDDRSAAEELRGLEVYIDALDLEPLPEGEHYVRNIIGCRVIDVAGQSAMPGGQDSHPANPGGQDSQSAIPSGSGGSENAGQPTGPSGHSDSGDLSNNGREIGVLRDVIQNTAQSILEVETPDGKIVLIPAVDEFLVNIDEKARVIKVNLIPGFID